MHMNQILSMQSNMDDGNNNMNNNLNNTKNFKNKPPKTPKPPKQPKQQKQPKMQNSYNDNSTVGNKANINSILRVFAILLIVFGLTLIGDSAYGYLASKPKLEDNIVVNVEKMGAEATIKATGGKPIKEISYKWGQGNETVVQGDGTVNLETTIEIPNGNNILNIKVVDYYGNVKEFQKQYLNPGVDNSKPTIEVSLIGNVLRLTAKDETEIAYITYKWNENQEIRVDMDQTQVDKKQLQTDVEVIKGQNTLTIVAVDKDGNRATRTENVKGANKPTFEVTAEGTKIIIKAKDDEGLSKISITVDGETTDTGSEPINLKEVTAEQEITPGTHTITIVVTNLSGLSEEQSFTATL